LPVSARGFYHNGKKFGKNKGMLTGVLLLGIIANGFNLLHIEASLQFVVTGFVIVIVVIMHEHRLR
jgi:ribose/xylose/arabinose/galactoside ABC-type transport system permease subunit